MTMASWNRAETLSVWNRRRSCWAEAGVGWSGISACIVMGWPIN